MPKPSPTGDSPALRRTRPSSLQRLMTSTGAAFWLIDAAGEIVYLSPAMSQWLGIENVVPEAVAAALVPAPNAWQGGRNARAHLTVRLHVADAPARQTGSAPQPVTAHFLRIRPWPIAAQAKHGTSSAPLVLGCLGDFRADTDVPWEEWFGASGVRESARLGEQLAKYRAQQNHRANLLLAGNASASRQLRARVELATRVRCHLALIGPPGCGAGELASRIHHASAPGEPWVCLDGSLMDAELLEVYAAPVIAELREHTECCGTLCFEQIDDMPQDAQARLVKWLETWPERLRLIGIRWPALSPGEHSVAEDDKPRSAAIEEQLDDLLSIFPIVIPRLSDRREDLELMASGLVRSARLSRETIELFQAYPWPGQWDELKTAIQFASEIATGDRITREHLPLAIRSYRSSQAGNLSTQHGNELTIGPAPALPRDFKLESLDETLREYEASLIEQAMAAAQGNKAEAARRLGISRSRLLRKLDEMKPRSGP